jgi:SAM-dependent methyltransferase
MADMNDTATYATSHTATGYGKRYNKNYSAGYYAALFREFELPTLKALWAELATPSSLMLDFACGTGRITSEATPYFGKVVGVDISSEMLKYAASNDLVDYRLQDIMAEPLNEKFDVVTSFRFFLNAEQALRERALEAIRGHLKPGGRLVCNIHMNSSSPLGMFFRLADRVPGLPRHNTLSLEQFSQTLSGAGFAVEKVIWYGVLPRPGHYFNGLMDRIIGPMERLAGRVGLQGRFAQSFMIVASIDDGLRGSDPAR